MMTPKDEEGMSNPAFETDDNPISGRRQQKPIAAFEVFENGDQQDDNRPSSSPKTGCSIFGLKIPLCERMFLSAAGFLVFLSWAAAIQVTRLKSLSVI
jgi:hypothetical protein